MTDITDKIAGLFAAARAASIDADQLLGSVATNLEALHIPPQATTTASTSRPVLSAGLARRPVRAESLRQAAARLGLDGVSIKRLLANGDLQAVTVGGTLAIPTWQYDAGSPSGLVPHIRAVLAAAEGRLSWIELAIIMATPQTALIAEADHNIVEWLHFGFPVDSALAVIRMEGRHD
ncbi:MULTISPECIES: hypothetical protein [unclassified Frondihabitans]|uniref:hypothetical protein n=1 Tax=unclassified Frondihabitans TaxID=2626248 RepID=UPI000F4D5B1A|nr:MULTISPECIES: hypothetical protein [unclassified Frondihabitans]RPE77859.1 hypothetical protein EDF37_0524 [Frondihabitans sp. PhB153]RPF08138.1 hypothetical protein EDF39_0525 [Frondihabitans sp. PhB161]